MTSEEEQTSTSHAVSSDSGVDWTQPGAWRVGDGIYRIPLPLPMDGLRAVNVYVIETERGLTLVDGGWAIEESRAQLVRSLGDLGFRLSDIRNFLVTHVHRDHYTQAVVVAREAGARVSLGLGEKHTLDVLHHAGGTAGRLADMLRSAGAHTLVPQWRAEVGQSSSDEAMWRYPDVWLEGDHVIEVGTRTLEAVHTPGHTQGHFVFADRTDGLLFAGDHVLPTITPSIGFEMVAVEQPLRDFMSSLAKVRALPDLKLLPAHGPVFMSSHERVDQLLEHHETRLRLCAEALTGGPATSYAVAGRLPWTRHERPMATLDAFNQGLASMETKAHLELLVARGRATRELDEDGVVFSLSLDQQRAGA